MTAPNPDLNGIYAKLATIEAKLVILEHLLETLYIGHYAAMRMPARAAELGSENVRKMLAQKRTTAEATRFALLVENQANQFFDRIIRKLQDDPGTRTPLS